MAAITDFEGCAARDKPSAPCNDVEFALNDNFLCTGATPLGTPVRSAPKI
jgi:hypothetical protein